MLKFVALVALVGAVAAEQYHSSYSSHSSSAPKISFISAPVSGESSYESSYGPSYGGSYGSGSYGGSYGSSSGSNDYKKLSYTTNRLVGSSHDSSYNTYPVVGSSHATYAPASVHSVSYSKPIVAHSQTTYQPSYSQHSYVAPLATAKYEAYESHHGPITAAVQSHRTVKTYDVPSTYSASSPLTIDVPSSSQTVNFLMRSKSSDINLETFHEPTPGTFRETASEEEPHVSRHTVHRPLVQEVREVITPHRKITQELQPVQEHVETVVPKGQHYQEQSYVAPAVSTAQYVAKPAVAVAAAPAYTVAAAPAVAHTQYVAAQPVAVAAAPAIAAAPAVTQYVAAAAPAYTVAAQPVAVVGGLTGGLTGGYGYGGNLGGYGTNYIQSLPVSSYGYGSYPFIQKKKK